MTRWSHPFDQILTAWRKGRPIVPLFGAGISVESGIPVTAGMISYLAQLRWRVDYAGRKDPLERSRTVAYLKKHGWPESHDLAAKSLHDLTQRHFVAPSLADGRRPDSLAEIECQAKVDSGLPTEGNVNYWRLLLNNVTDAFQDLKDSFFDRFEFGRVPSTCHQFAAYLAGLMNWRLLLTTNFDSFLERAQREIGLDPKLYELPEEGPTPDPGLIAANFSLMKLHGGAFGRRMSESLEYSLHPTVRRDFVRYLQPNTLLLVIGYSGGDRRVMSLIDEYLRRDEDDQKPKVIWIHREKDEPPGLKILLEGLNDDGVDDRIITHHYLDGGRFLQELYCRATTAHPVTSSSYRALVQQPHEVEMRLTGSSQELLGEPPVHFIKADGEASGSSTSLAHFVQSKLPQEMGYFETIWCDLGILSTVDSLVAHLQHEFRRFDPALPPFALFPAPRDAGKDPRIDYLVEAMRRAKYVIAIDAMSEFGTAHISDRYRHRTYLRDASRPAAQSELNRIGTEAIRLYRFLQSLVLELRKPRPVQSRLCLSVGRIALPITEDGGHQLLSSGEYDGFLKELSDQSPPQPRWKEQCLNALDELLSEHTRQRMEVLNGEDRQILRTSAKLLWNDTSPTWQSYIILLAICATFRRPRNIVALRRLMQPALRTVNSIENIDKYLHYVCMQSTSIWNADITDELSEELDQMLDVLHDAGLLLRQEGGFYWMHRVLRDEFYEQLFQFSKRNPSAIGALHDAIANYYYHHLSRPSKDVQALFEYLFHRTASLRAVPFALNNKQYDAYCRERNHRAREMIVVLRRERDHLLTSAHPGLLVPWVRYIRDTELLACHQQAECDKDRNKIVRDAFVAFDDTYRDARAFLCDLEAEALRQAGRHAEGLALRIRQIRDRVAEDPAGLESDGKLNDAIDTLNRLEDAIWSAHATMAPESPSHHINYNDATAATLIVKKTAARWAPKTTRVERLSRKDCVRWLRLVDHVGEIAVCLIGLQLKNQAAQRILNTTKTELQKRAGALSLLDEQVREQLLDAQIRCGFRLVDLALDQVSPWSEFQTEAGLLHHAESEFTEALKPLHEYTTWRGRDYLRYTCFLNTIRGRVACLRHRWGEAYLYFNTAQAALRDPRAGSEYAAIGIALLHLAECLILDSHYNWKAPHDAKNEGVANPIAVARAKLERAEVALRRAREVMGKGRPHLWAWTWYFQLEAQLHHEFLLLRIDRHTQDAQDQVAKERPDVDQREILDMDDYRHVLEGLRAIRSGIDAGRNDVRRQRELRILYWQMLTCFLCERCHRERRDLASWDFYKFLQIAVLNKDSDVDQPGATEYINWCDLVALANLAHKPLEPRRYRKSLERAINSCFDQHTRNTPDTRTWRQIVIDLERAYVQDLHGTRYRADVITQR